MFIQIRYSSRAKQDAEFIVLQLDGHGLDAGDYASASDLFSVLTLRDAAIFPPAAKLL